MLQHRPWASLGHADHGWLQAGHHFSFGGYHHPERTQWGVLRVWNDDTIAAGAGFPPHPHADMEIITYVREGAISHQDSLGNRGRTAAGDVQVMSAGTGIEHAEYNAESGPTTLFQIWLFPDASRPRQAPTWAMRQFPKADRAGQWVVLASGQAEAQALGALPLRARGSVSGAVVVAGQRLDQPVDPEEWIYLVPTRGRVRVNGLEINARDGLAMHDESAVVIEALEDAEIVMVRSWTAAEAKPGR